jgi:nitroreductase
MDMDGRTTMPATTFFGLLARTMPRFDGAPWNALGPPTCVHLALFVHRVDGLEPGAYVLVRDEVAGHDLRAAMRDDFTWRRAAGAPEKLPLYQLLAGDCRAFAAHASCDQTIASHGAFSCAMLAEFEPRLIRHGPWFYRRLFWEAGVIGQVLYLEAEAAGLRGTGIGCFFDDVVHQALGLSEPAIQSLYHFTIGGPVEDSRLTTLPPYAEDRRLLRPPSLPRTP